MDLTARELTVLGCVVELYISSGSPVASRQIARRSGLGLSSASIRNVMAQLENRGLLTRPHPSAGSVPTDQSFRIYVDTLRPRNVPAVVRHRLEDRMSHMRRELVEDLEWVAKVTADATREAGMAMRPIGQEPVVEAVSLVPLSGDRVLGVMVTSDGAVEKRVFSRDDHLRSEDLQEESNYLTNRFRGSSVVEIRRRIQKPEAIRSRSNLPEPIIFFNLRILSRRIEFDRCFPHFMIEIGLPTSGGGLSTGAPPR
jgi:heat-inducible transcriptional repressor